MVGMVGLFCKLVAIQQMGLCKQVKMKMETLFTRTLTKLVVMLGIFGRMVQLVAIMVRVEVLVILIHRLIRVIAGGISIPQMVEAQSTLVELAQYNLV